MLCLSLPLSFPSSLSLSLPFSPSPSLYPSLPLSLHPSLCPQLALSLWLSTTPAPTGLAYSDGDVSESLSTLLRAEMVDNDGDASAVASPSASEQSSMLLVLLFLLSPSSGRQCLTRYRYSLSFSSARSCSRSDPVHHAAVCKSWLQRFWGMVSCTRLDTSLTRKRASTFITWIHEINEIE